MKHGESILTKIIYFSRVLEAATQSKYTERRDWRIKLAGKCSCNVVERVHIGLASIYSVQVALNYRVAAE